MYKKLLAILLFLSVSVFSCSACALSVCIRILLLCLLCG